MCIIYCTIFLPVSLKTVCQLIYYEFERDNVLGTITWLCKQSLRRGVMFKTRGSHEPLIAHLGFQYDF